MSLNLFVKISSPLFLFLTDLPQCFENTSHIDTLALVEVKYIYRHIHITFHHVQNVWRDCNGCFFWFSRKTVTQPTVPLLCGKVSSRYNVRILYALYVCMCMHAFDIYLIELRIILPVTAYTYIHNYTLYKPSCRVFPSFHLFQTNFLSANNGH